jgi:hypothetical protein
MSTDEILARHSIDNPSDAAIVRLAAAALSLPDQPADALIKRVNFTHQADAALGRALIETVRDQAPATIIQSGKATLGWATAAVFAVMAGVGATLWLQTSRELRQVGEESRLQQAATENSLANLQKEFAGQVAQLQQQFTSARAESDRSLQGNVEVFTRTMTDQVQRIHELTRENTRLQVDLSRAQAEAAAAANTLRPPALEDAASSPASFPAEPAR